eukprot:161432_1
MRLPTSIKERLKLYNYAWGLSSLRAVVRAAMIEDVGHAPDNVYSEAQLFESLVEPRCKYPSAAGFKLDCKNVKNSDLREIDQCKLERTIREKGEDPKPRPDGSLSKGRF